MDDEFDMIADEHEEENSNSFINTLCERLAQQFALKHIHYGPHPESPVDFEQLKMSIIESMSSCSGYIVDHFPATFDDLDKFRTEVKNFSMKNDGMTIFSFFDVEDRSLYCSDLHRWTPSRDERWRGEWHCGTFQERKQSDFRKCQL